MRVIVFSDVHGNLPALETMLHHAGKADHYVCLGDNVNYGPWGEECVHLVASLPDCVCLEGNHETAFLKGSYDGPNPLPKLFFAECYPRFQSFDLIKNLPADHRMGGFRFVHTLEGKNIYPDTEVALTENTFIGHSHHQFLKKINGLTLVNVGSVGQNRRYINLASYAVFYPETGAVELNNVEYNVDLVMAEMRRLKFPTECLAYYENKPQFEAAPA